MRKLLKLTIFIIPVGIALFLFFADGSALAQTEFQPPTVLPAEDIDIGGRRGECIGLATMIRTGDIHLWNLPCYIKFFTQTLVAIAGSLAVIFVMVGGYRYVIGPDEQKAESKKTIIYALIGLAVTLMAWIIIDLILVVATE